MLHLDGSHGEGGGQILRTSLSLSALWGQPLRMEQIRAGRPKPGLRPQHLAVVRALAQVTRAEVKGAELNSRELTFRPRRPQPGTYVIDVAEKRGSAGSVSLIAQALLPPLLQAEEPSRLIIRGGTHVPWSPPAQYLERVFLPALAQMGARVTMRLSRWGWYPRGGGEVELAVFPTAGLTAVEWQSPPAVESFRGLSAASGLPEHVIQRQAERLRARLGGKVQVEELRVEGRDPGSLVFLWGPGAGFSALGARGKPAENVAEEAAEGFLRFQERRGAVDCHLADQLVLYLALARGRSVLVTDTVTSHLLTNLWAIGQFVGPVFEVEGEPGDRGIITCRGGKG